MKISGVSELVASWSRNLSRSLAGSLLVVLSSCLSIGLLFGCSSGGSMTAHERPQDFYSQFVNPSDQAARAKESVEELKLLETGSEYPIRVTLFDNGKFYYQIDKLGEGDGEWTYSGGALQLIAKRPIFDMTMHVSAAQAGGEAMVVRFFDRFGFNSVPLTFRDPPRLKKEGVIPPSLRKFESSTKSI